MECKNKIKNREGRSLCNLLSCSALFIHWSYKLTECSQAGCELAGPSCFTVPVGFWEDNLSGSEQLITPHVLVCFTAEIHTAAVRSLLFCYGIEGVVHPKMKVLSSFIHPQVFLTYFLLWNINVWVLFLNGSQSYLVPNFLHKLLFLRKKEMHVWNDVNFHFCVDCPFNKHLSNLHMGYKLPFLRKWLVELNRLSLSLSNLHCFWYVVCVFVAVCTFDFTAQVFFM